jgi:hypothetical protein
MKSQIFSNLLFLRDKLKKFIILEMSNPIEILQRFTQILVFTKLKGEWQKNA